MTKRKNKQNENVKTLTIIFLVLIAILIFSEITAANRQRQINNVVKMQQEQIKEYRAKNGITKRGVDEFSNEMRILHQQKKP